MKARAKGKRPDLFSRYDHGTLEGGQLFCCFLLVAHFFRYNIAKTLCWFETPNPLLGDISPMTMIYAGRVERLLKFVRTQIEENAPPPKPRKSTR